jgi:hypothetical protein
MSLELGTIKTGRAFLVHSYSNEEADFGGLRPDLKLAQLNEEDGVKKCPFQCNTPREGSIGLV